VKIGISNPTSDGDSGELLRRDLLDDILGEVVASVVAPINVVANINPDEDGNGLLPNLLGRVSATVQASPTITAHIFDSDKDDSGELLRRDLLDDILGEVIASVVAPINVVANINPDEDGNGLLPNLLGRVSATVQVSPTITAHIFDSDKDDSGELLRRDLLDDILGEVIASVVAPINVVANINPDEDGNGLLPNLLGRVSLTVQASPTITAHIFDSDKDDSGELLKREAVHAGVFTERLDGDRVAIYVPIEALAKSHSDVSQIVSAGNDAMQVRRLHTVRPEHVQTIQAMFPDISEGAIRADLARTGSPTITSDNILRNGGTLPPPPPPPTLAGQRAEALAATAEARDNATGSRGMETATASSSGIMLNAAQSPLVSRLHVAKSLDAGPLPPQPPKVWESDSARRAEILNKRKEFMLLEARKRYLDKQAQSGSAATSDSPSTVAGAAAEASGSAASDGPH
ncbi:hypothetical protein IWQ56_001917, partial [Coemansia nantahalensis]